jgi:hypothetical protein
MRRRGKRSLRSTRGRKRKEEEEVRRAELK